MTSGTVGAPTQKICKRARSFKARSVTVEQTQQQSQSALDFDFHIDC